jgi:hypothetical protein
MINLKCPNMLQEVATVSCLPGSFEEFELKLFPEA